MGQMLDESSVVVEPSAGRGSARRLPGSSGGGPGTCVFSLRSILLRLRRWRRCCWWRCPSPLPACCWPPCCARAWPRWRGSSAANGPRQGHVHQRQPRPVQQHEVRHGTARVAQDPAVGPPAPSGGTAQRSAGVLHFCHDGLWRVRQAPQERTAGDGRGGQSSSGSGEMDLMMGMSRMHTSPAANLARSASTPRTYCR